MDLLDHYLGAVAAQLDKNQREDIIAELRDTLLTRFEEREAALGRPPTDDEREAILRDMGHPLVVAARYGKGPQHLAGPELFPWWRFAVKAGLMVLVALLVVQIVLGFFTMPQGISDALRYSLGDLIEGGLIWIGLVTVGVFMAERSGWRPGFIDNWRVKDLPVLRLSDPEAWQTVMTGDRNSPQPWWSAKKHPARWPTGEAIFGLVALTLFIAWWTDSRSGAEMGSVMMANGEALVAPAAVWRANFAPILLLAIGQLWIELLRLMRPQWVRGIAGLQAIAAGVGLAIAWAVFHAGHWFTLSDGGDSVRVAGGWGQLGVARLLSVGQGTRDLIGVGDLLSVVLSWVLVGIMISMAVAVVRHLLTLVRGQG